MATETTETTEQATPTTGRQRSAGRTTRKRTTRARKKTAARKRTAKKAAPARRSRVGGGSTYLADSLSGLLTDVTAEVATVSALSAAIDDAARALQAQLAEFSERIATLSRLRKSVSGGTLAAFLDETLVPDRPTELALLTDRIKGAQSAAI